ncbi:hypothetical protein RCL1_007562 [Eukaryota sp. TZLM3-RCL]
MTSTLSLVEDSEGNQYYKKTIDRFLSEEEISLLTSLKHPSLVGYYHTDEQETNELIFDYCEFGSFPELDVSRIALDAHDLWSMRNQILQALKYLASYGLYHKGLNVSNVLVCSLYPIKVKLSLLSNSRVLIGPVNTEIPIPEFWNQKMNKQEEVCFDDLIRSIVKSVFPYSIIDKNIVFTNPNTLEQNDLESLKALICSIESETMFKSDQCIGDFSSVNNNLSCIFKSLKSQEQKNLFFSKTLFFHVFTEGILKFKRPLLEFYGPKSHFACKNTQFSKFAKKIISTSVNFRNVFFRAFECICESRGHCLELGYDIPNTDAIISSHCFKMPLLSSISVVYLNWLNRFPITSITTSTLNFDTGMIDTEKVTKLDLKGFCENLSPITLFPNLSCFALNSSRCIQDFSVLTSCCCNLSSLSISRCHVADLTPFSTLSQLTFLTLDNNPITDITPLSSLKQLRSLSLNTSSVFDLWPLKNLTKLSTLDVRETLLPKEHQNQLTNSSEVKALINSFEHGVFGLDFSNYDYIVDLSLYSHCSRLKSLNLSRKSVENITEISKFTNLETLDLSNVRLPSNNNITEISFLSSCLKLKLLSLEGSNVADLSPLSLLVDLESLSLKNTKVFDLWPLKNLTKLSTLDLRETLLHREYRRKLTNSFEIKNLINLFEYGPFNLDFSNYNGTIDLSLYSHCSRLKSLNLSNKRVDNISEISKFTSIETLDLSHVRLIDYNIITDISFLSSCINLKSLSLDGSNVTDLYPLSLISNNLKSLSLNRTLFTNLSQLSLFKHLEVLSLNANRTLDYASLSSLDNLSTLSLRNSKVSNLKPLQKLKKLNCLDVRETFLPQELQLKVSGLSCVQELLNNFTVQRVYPSINLATRKRTFISESSLKKVNK